MKALLKFLRNLILCLLAAVLIFVGGGLGILTLLEYKPDDVITTRQAAEAVLTEGESLTCLTWNIGYGALSATEDFFMDGGTKVSPDNKDLVWANLQAIAEKVAEEKADFVFLQETDINSDRSFHINEKEYFEKVLEEPGWYACNFKSIFTPYPIPPIGRVESGLVTFSRCDVMESSRISLPCPFSWPVRIANLKRCLLETRIPIKGSDRELVLINLHLEAYDSGEGKIAQTRQLSEKLAEEYAKGNYVIAGGDFNQTFDTVVAPVLKNRDAWRPGTISTSDLPEGFSFACAYNAATCRLLDAPYSKDSQLYIIDGFIVSDNIRVDQVQVIDADFQNADHNPVRMSLTLLK